MMKKLSLSTNTNVEAASILAQHRLAPGTWVCSSLPFMASQIEAGLTGSLLE